MTYLITFLEGMITFISPCLLPMLPIYISYFAGGGERSVRHTARNALGFILGFTTVFILLGALAGSLGSLLSRYQTLVNIVTGVIVILFGLSFLGVIKLNIFRGSSLSTDVSDLGFFSSFLFGLVFSIGWTPCVGAFLGSALMLASQQGHILQGILLLLSYSLGLGVPFFISALLIDQLKGALAILKKHYALINRASGILLIIIGLFMATGMMNRLLVMFS